MQLIMNFWASDLTLPGRHLIVFLVFIIFFMLIGRFRFCFISGLLLVYFVFFFQNRQLIDKAVSQIGSAGLLIGAGALFLGLSVWSFFIDSD